MAKKGGLGPPFFICAFHLDDRIGITTLQATFSQLAAASAAHILAHHFYISDSLPQRSAALNNAAP